MNQENNKHVHPGVVFNNLLIQHLSRELNVQRSYLIALMNGEAEVSEKVAERLGSYFGTMPEYWTILNDNYYGKTKANPHPKRG